MSCTFLNIWLSRTVDIYLCYIQVIIAILAIVFGVVIFSKPKKAIELQISFYRSINWKVEPISIVKEVRNTRIMGAILFLCGAIALSYIIMMAIIVC